LERAQPLGLANEVGVFIQEHYLDPSGRKRDRQASSDRVAADDDLAVVTLPSPVQHSERPK
jgi:hypothetical protein